MIGLPTSTTSSTRSRVDVGLAQQLADELVERGAHRTRSARASPPGFIITYDTRLIRSSPKRICGFIRPADASTSPVARSQRWPAIVVDPTSIGDPERACRRSPARSRRRDVRLVDRDRRVARP